MEKTISKGQLIARLRVLRQTIELEQEAPLSTEQASLLTDICEQALGLSEEETFMVVGDGYLQFGHDRSNWPALTVVESLLGKDFTLDGMTQVDVPAFLLDGPGPVDAQAFREFVTNVKNEQSR